MLIKKIFIYWQIIKNLPVEPIVHTAIGVVHEFQSRGVSKLLLHTAPLLLTQTSHAIGSEPGYDDVEHSNNVIWCTRGFFVVLKTVLIIKLYRKLNKIFIFCIFCTFLLLKLLHNRLYDVFRVILVNGLFYTSIECPCLSQLLSKLKELNKKKNLLKKFSRIKKNKTDIFIHLIKEIFLLLQ